MQKVEGTVKKGNKVIWHTGFMGAEQGQQHDSWWPQNKAGKIVQVRGKMVLLELTNRERRWASVDEIEMEEQ